MEDHLVVADGADLEDLLLGAHSSRHTGGGLAKGNSLDLNRVASLRSDGVDRSLLFDDGDLTRVLLFQGVGVAVLVIGDHGSAIGGKAAVRVNSFERKVKYEVI